MDDQSHRDKLMPEEEEVCRRFHWDPVGYLKRKKEGVVYQSELGSYIRFPVPAVSQAPATKPRRFNLHFLRLPPELIKAPPELADDIVTMPLTEEPTQGLRLEDSNIFRREGRVWTISYEGETVQLPHITGLEYISILLKNAGKSLSAKQLDALTVSKDAPIATHSEVDVRGELPSDCELQDDELDDKGRKKIETRARQIPGEIEEAERRGDRVKAENLKQEADELTDYLNTTTGRGGRSRKHSKDLEKCRTKITHAINRALEAIAEHAPKIAAYLKRNIGTGATSMIYRDGMTAWKF